MGIKKVSKDFYIFILMIISAGAVVPTVDYVFSKFFKTPFNIYNVGLVSLFLFFICLIYLIIRAKKGKLNLDFLVRYENEQKRN